MKTKKSIFATFASMLMMVMCLFAINTFGESSDHPKKKHDYCVMKDGKMMCMKGGKMMAMDMEMTMKNGVKVMTNGEYMDEKGNKMMLKEGEMIDSHGMVMMPNMKRMTMKKHSNMTTKKTTKTENE